MRRQVFGAFGAHSSSSQISPDISWSSQGQGQAVHSSSSQISPDTSTDISWSSRGASLLKSGVFSDVRVRVDNEIFSCHKIVLASASEFFEKLFEKECLTTEPVELSETTPNIFKAFLNYIYTWNDETLRSLKTAELLGLLKSLHMWMAVEVEKTCSKLINNRCSSMQLNELIKLFAAAHLLDNNSIMDMVIRTLKNGKNNFNAFSANHIDSPEILNMGIECFTDYFQRINQSMEISIRFRLAEKWIQRNAPGATVSYSTNANINPNNSKPVSLLEKIAHIIQSIDFVKNMSVSDFYNGPGKSMVLTDSSKYEIIYKIACRSRSNNSFY